MSRYRKVTITEAQATDVLTIVQRIAKARYDLDRAANEFESAVGHCFSITRGSEDLDGEDWQDITPADVMQWVESLDVED
jgi:hypothetical protein